MTFRQKEKEKSASYSHWKKFKVWFTASLAVFFIIVMAGLVGVFLFERKFSQKIFQGVLVGEIDVGGMTQEQALALLKQKEDELIRDGIHFVSEKNDVLVSAEILASDPDLFRRIIYVDIEKAVNDAYAFGRTGSWLDNNRVRLLLFFQPKSIVVPVSINEYKILEILREGFQNEEISAVNAHMKIEDGSLTIVKERSGSRFDYEAALAQLKKNLSNFDFSPIEMKIIVEEPTIFSEDIKPFLPKVQSILSTTTPLLTYEGKQWPIEAEQIKEWLEVGYRDAEDGAKQNLGLLFHKDALFRYLSEIAQEIDVLPVNAKFELIDGRVTQFRSSKNGRKLDIEESYRKINKQYFQDGVREIELIVDIVPPDIKTGDINNLGIKELLGVGRSNFAGSPENRRKNIANGVRLLNGLLIKPGEEFSLLQALKPFNGANGYVEELVIKGNRTIPEYGGGLCQIGTTVFRAALHSGLKITERQNHSYRVPYYEPAGMDATIYDPAPDFKFINDTPGYILIVAEMQGDELIFSFYGTSDGRVAKVPEKAKVYNIVPPGEPRYIETDELPPGEKKLIEKPHAGATAEFDYIVEYPDGRIHKETFVSYYVPWRETWLIGKTLEDEAGDISEDEDETNQKN